jgi:deoxycytidylate deaminase
MNTADEIAKYSEHPHYKIAAVLIYKGKIVASATNSFSKTHPIQFKLRNKLNNGIGKPLPYVHAEVKVLDIAMKKGIDLSKCSLFISRITKSGKQSISKPCNECMYFIRSNRIKNIIYYNRNGEIMVQFIKGKI